MMKLTVSQFMSLDGVVQAPGGPEEDTDGGFAHGGWSMPYFDPEVMGGFIDAGVQQTDALLFGRRTWEVMAAHWPERETGDDPFAERMNSIDKYVVSGTLGEADMTWSNSTLIPAEGMVGAVARLKAGRDGGLGVMGSARLTEALVAAGLVDEYRLLVEPVILGGGKRVFPTDGEKRPLELVETTTAGTGVICCVYRPGETPPMPDWGE